MRDFAEIGGWKPLYLNHCQVSVRYRRSFFDFTRQPLLQGSATRTIQFLDSAWGRWGCRCGGRVLNWGHPTFARTAWSDRSADPKETLHSTRDCHP